MISFIWAEDESGAIGKNGKLPWRLPNDMKFFKATTTGKTVVMGRKTFESMGKRLLPNRKNIIITRQNHYDAGDAYVIQAIEELALITNKEEDIYIIGGSEIYSLFLPYADTLWQTKIEADFQGDTFFPTINWNEWELDREYDGLEDDKNIYAHVFRKFTRKNKAKPIR
ncbi:dihydrofolate reductase [Jeotgalibaca sp. MA1X17-3]|uniref:dihydrofolate reductase n=1 Tax=Jeotgalibaca sp. MA1X17-3 TaxID=2908211 RepID=UPI001F1E3368|nr:dihydrofolate reductase [Jeotgalibaca sp. MA1X17-3]UJF14795.1 dihydrofolate reductase [Jeotgalibaca sp. MA1X17-3]